MPTHFKCKYPGCDKLGAVAGYCNNHFREFYGITAEQYRAEKRARKEDPREVAKRIKADNLLTLEKKEKPMSKKASNPSPEEAGATRPAPPPAPPKPATSGTVMAQPNCPLLQIFLDPELLEALTSAAKKAYRTPELHAAYLIDLGVRG